MGFGLDIAHMELWDIIDFVGKMMNLFDQIQMPFRLWLKTSGTIIIVHTYVLKDNFALNMLSSHISNLSIVRRPHGQIMIYGPMLQKFFPAVCQTYLNIRVGIKWIGTFVCIVVQTLRRINLCYFGELSSPIEKGTYS